MKHILLSVAIVIALLTGCSSSDSTRAISELSENEARELAISALAEDDIQNGSGEFTLEQHLEIAECSIDYMKNNSDYTYVELAQYWTISGDLTTDLDMSKQLWSVNADTYYECEVYDLFESGADGYMYGDNDSLDNLWDSCEGGSFTACDSLFSQSAIGSIYESFALCMLEGLNWDRDQTICDDEGMFRAPQFDTSIPIEWDPDNQVPIDPNGNLAVCIDVDEDCSDGDDEWGYLDNGLISPYCTSNTPDVEYFGGVYCDSPFKIKVYEPECPNGQPCICIDPDGSCDDGDDDWGWMRGTIEEFFCSNDSSEYAESRGGVLCKDA